MCFYDDDSDGYCDIWRETNPTARKPHRCYECRGTINPGEAYKRVDYVHRSEAGSYKTCRRCEAVRQRIHEVEIARGCRDHESWCPTGQLQEAIWNEGDHYGLMVRDEEGDADHVDPLVAHLFPDATVGIPVTARVD
jgi:hypothetical protein